MELLIIAFCIQVWAGSKQKELKASSLQLMHQSAPWVVLLLAILVPVCEPIGLTTQAPDTDSLLGYHYTLTSIALIACTAVLGLLVSASTFLAIGATSSVTFNVTGHLKTTLVIGGGWVLFGDPMPMQRLIGVVVTVAGVIWYSYLRLKASSEPLASEPSADKQPLLQPDSARSVSEDDGGK